MRPASYSVDMARSIQAAGEDFLAARMGAVHMPAPEEVSAYLDRLVAERTLRSAYAKFAFLQMAAAERWGAKETAFFARVLREHRVAAKPAAKTHWERVEDQISRLPADWQNALRSVADASKLGEARATGLVFTPSRLTNIASALVRWADYCGRDGLNFCPTGQTMKRFAEQLQASSKVTTKSVGYYLERIASGYFGMITCSAVPPGVEFVVADYLGAKCGSATKTASQIVGASNIFALGRAHYEGAKQRAFIGAEAALQARDGVLLMLAAALGFRADALAALSFGTTLVLGPRPQLMVDVPGTALKMRQRAKARARLRDEFSNPDLWDALQEYRTHFRPVLDGGDAVFPSKLALGQALSSARLSNIMGALTTAHFGVRITLHRVRDNVATEAVEEMSEGLSVAVGVLRHKDHRTTQKYYIRQQGRIAMQQLAKLTDEVRGKRTRLKL